MQERLRSGSSGLGEMQFSKRASSEGRFWTGFDAATYDVTRGIAERAPATTYTIVMHMSAPVAGTGRCGGPTLHRTMRPGDIDLVPFGWAAAWRDDAPGTVLNVKLTPALVRSAAVAMNLDPGAVSIPPRLHLKDPKLEHLGWALVAELEGGEHSDRLFAESISNAIAVHLVRRYSGARPVEFSQGLSRRRFALVIDYINDNLATNLSLAELAAVAGLSPSHFNSLFKQSSGVAVHQYVIRQRVERAVKLLSKGDVPLTDIAERAGFSDQSHMARCMRRLTGMTPSAFLRHYQ